MPSAPIPTVLRIDVEPDEHQPAVGERPWDGFLAMFDMIETLRRRLSDVTGHAVRPTWLIRLDPDVERAFGRTDFPVRRHHDLFNRILKHSDVLGIHVHALRWNIEKAVVFSDFADEAWPAECLQVATSTFQSCFGAPPQAVSFGGYFMRESVLDTVVDLGIRADITVEPGLSAKHQDVSFGAYSTAPSGNFLRCPRLPYYPSRTAFDTPATSAEEVRPLLMVPLASCDPRMILKRWYRRLVRRERPRYEPLSTRGKSGEAREGSGTWRSGLQTNCGRRISPLLFVPKPGTPTRTDESVSYSNTCRATQSLSAFGLSARCRRRSSRWPVRAHSSGRQRPPVLDFNERVNCCGDFFNHPSSMPHVASPSPTETGLNVARKYSQHFVGQSFSQTSWPRNTTSAVFSTNNS